MRGLHFVCVIPAKLKSEEGSEPNLPATFLLTLYMPLYFAGKKCGSSEIPEFHKGGPLRTGSEASRTNEKLEKSIIFWGGSGHPNHAYTSYFQKDLES